MGTDGENQVVRRSDAWVIRCASLSAGSFSPDFETVPLALNLLNGRLAAATALLAHAGRAARLLELRLAPFTPETDVRDLASLRWQAFHFSRDPVLPRVLHATGYSRFRVVSCTPFSVVRLPFRRQIWGRQHPDTLLDSDGTGANRVEEWRCPWPDVAVVRALEPLRRAGVLRRMVLPFWTYRQFFERDPWRSVPFAARGLEYARYLRRLRTAL